ncbi:MAG: PqiC family protein [Candidatus Rokuibacteriota bacterium]
MRLRSSLHTVVALLALLGVAGCFSRSVPPRSYVLAAGSTPTSAAAGRGPAVGVGPMVIPAYLDRPAIVLRAAGDEVRLSEEHRWAESLKDGVARVVAENLSVMIPTDAIVIYPWKSLWTIQYRVTLEILRFDGPLGGAAVLNARWRLLDGTGKELVLRAVNLSEAAGGPTHAALVSAQSRLLERVSRDIAAEIRSRSL